MRLVVISDTHFPLSTELFPEGDILIHCGDHTMNGQSETLLARLNFLSILRYKWKIVLAGNHDFALERDASLRKWAKEELKERGLIYLQHEAVEVEGVKFFGSPFVPNLMDWAFHYEKKDGRSIWSNIPQDTQILITHGPPRGILDMTVPKYGSVNAGCQFLREKLFSLPSLTHHLFGHIHEGYGQRILRGLTFINASHCDESYRMVNPPVVVEL